MTSAVNKHTRLAVILLFLCNICLTASMILPMAPKTASSLQASKTIAGTPTTAPLIKRYDADDQSNLDLYQNWASMCRQDKNNIALVATDQGDINNDSANDLSINNLWKTVTQTVNCGGGHALTVTKTVTATSTSKPTSSKSGYSCTGQCWSDYLWRKYLSYQNLQVIQQLKNSKI